MNKILLSFMVVLLWCGQVLGQDARLVNVEVEEFVHDGSIAELAGFTTYRVFAQTLTPQDEVVFCIGDDVRPLHINTSTSFFKGSLNLGSPTASTVFFIPGPAFESLKYSSYVTIGWSSNANFGIPVSDDPTGNVAASGSSSVSTAQDPGAPWTAGFGAGGNVDISTLIGGGWFDTPGNANVLGQGANNSVLVAQLTTDGELDFGLNIQVNGANDVDSIFGHLTSPTLGLVYPAMDDVVGCMDAGACNFDPAATIEGDCQYNDDCGVCGGDNSTCSGCIDLTACNYDASSTVDDGSCEYDSCAGCTDVDACNYNETATIDDDSCVIVDAGFISVGDQLTTFCAGDGMADEMSVGGGPALGSTVVFVVTELDGTVLAAQEGNQFDFEGAEPGTCLVYRLATDVDVNVDVLNINDIEGCHSLSNAIEVVREEGGCMDVTAANYNADAVCGSTDLCEYDAVLGCTDETACNFDVEATEDDGSCLELDCAGVCGGDAVLDACEVCGGDGSSCVEVPGCTDETACNFDEEATMDDGSCLVLDCAGVCGGDAVLDACEVCGGDGSSCVEVPGCTDETACNFDEEATEDDGSCLVLDCAGVCGGDAVLDACEVCGGDGSSCVEVPGCTDETACNFDEEATEDDGSCEAASLVFIPTELFVAPAVIACEAPAGYILADQDCVNAIIAEDPYCLDTEWDDLCQDAYDCCLGLGVVGCTDESATNYNPDATCGDDSCEYTNVCVLVCADDVILECGSDISVSSTGTPFYQGECIFPGVEEWAYDDVTSGDGCLTIVERTFYGFDGLECTQTITLVDSEGPVFPAISDVNVECVEDIPAPLMLTATDACTAEDIAATHFESTTGTPTQVCVLSEAMGPGDDWSVWLQGFSQGASDNFVWDADGGTFDVFADGTAHLYGTVVNDTDASQGWIVDIWFENGVDWTDWSAQGRWYKDDLGYGADHFEDWTYYEMVPFSTLTGIGSFDGDELLLTHNPASFFFGFQCGLGANNKNANEGFSGWFNYEGNVGGEYVYGNGDVNVDKECSEPENPPVCENDTEVTYLYRATDACGNTTVETQVITVRDLTAPEFVAPPADMTISCEEWPMDLLDCVATDNCVGEITYVGPTETIEEGSCPNNLTVTRTWGAVDECGNTNTHVQVITVIDETAPVITCPADMAHECDETPDYGFATATDNCTDVPAVTVVETESGDSCDKVITRVFTATDECGNESSCTQTITITDSTAPVFGEFTPYVHVECDELETVEDAITVTDNCNDVTVTYTETPVSGGCMGGLQRVYTATDACGNTSSIEQFISLQDTTAPVVECPENATYECDQDIPEAVTPVAYDNCGFDVTIEFAETVEGDICLTTITRTWTVTDYCENVTVCTQVITVEDTTDPIITVPADLTFECDAIGEYGEASATDNCDDEVEIEVTETEETGDCVAEIVVTRTFRAFDDCGNSSIAVQTITIVDTTAPELTIPGDLTFECDAVGAYGEATATDNCSEYTISVDEVETGDSCNRTITRTFVATDVCGNASAPQTQTITIVDTTIPVLTIPADLSFECDAIGEYGEASATDNCNDVTISMTETDNNDLCERVITRTFTATDLCGNASAPQTQTITIVDTTAPVIDGLDEVDMPCDAINQNYLATASDNCNDIEFTFTDSFVSGGCAGQVIRTYVATDLCGNTSEFTQILDLFDDVAPEITCAPDMTIECDEDMPAMVEPDYSDNCGDVTLTSEVIEEGDDCLRTVTRIWTATDECNNSSTCQQVITIQDTTAPTITAAADATVECGDALPAPAAEVADNCNDVDWTVEASEVATCGDTYVMTRTYTATDACGNTATDVQVITVVDTTAPVITCPADVMHECDETVDYGTATATDTCGDVTVAFTDVETGDSCETVITRTYTATDACDNTSTCVQTITIVDTTAPLLTLPADVSHECDESPAYGVATATDNCNAVTVTSSDVETGDSCERVITRTWTAVDACDNMTSGVQTITIVDTTAPTITAAADAVVECGDELPEPAATAADNCNEVDWTVEATIADTCGDTFVMTRTYTATDACGNSSTDVQVITVVDTTAPMITAAADATVECGDALPAPAADASDSCGNATWTVEASEVATCGDTFVMTRTYTATDDCGNTATDVQVITVVDTTAPVITCPADVSHECDETVDYGTATATDTCGDVTVAFTDVETGDSCETVIERTWTATDACDNTSTCVQTITIVDTTAPVITGAEEIDMPCDDVDGNILVEVTDNCNAVNVTITYEDVFVSGGCVGQIIRTYTANDGCGNVSEFVQILDLFDDVAPTLECPADESYMCSEEVPTAVEPTYSDNCTDVTLSLEETTTGDSCMSTITRVWTATDECNNTSTCTQTIVISDTTAPVITCPADVTYECTDTVDAGEATAEDNCNDVTITSSDVTTGDDCETVITRTWTATDACGNASTCVQTITIVDTTAPVITCPADATFECDETVDAGEATATDNCNDVTITSSDVTTGDVCETVIERTWTATDACGNASTCVQTITIVDTTAPVITCPADVSHECDESPAYGAATATDNCDDDVTVTSSDVTSGDDCETVITRTWTATDVCGNASTCVQTITIVDTTAPVITCPADVMHECDEEVAYGMATATDNCNSVEVTSNDVTSGDDCETVITRTWTATDACGNASTCVQTITIVDTTAPVLTLPADVSHECDEMMDYGMATATDNCNDVTVTSSDVTTGDDCETVITRTWTATDACNNMTSGVQTITIVDTTAPVLTLPADVSHECSDVVDYGMATATDNCNAVTVTSSDVESGDSCETVITRTWTATDACGNTTSDTQEIVIVDTTAPVFATVPADMNFQCLSDVPASVDPMATDNCQVADVTCQSVEDLDDCGNGTITRTCTAADGCGNATTISYVITILDTEAPVLTAQPADLVLDCEDSVPTAADVTAVDNCDNDPSVIFEEVIIGDQPAEGSIADCVLSTPGAPLCHNDPSWSLKLFNFPGYEFFTTVNASFVEYEDGTAHITGRVQAVNNANAYFDIDVLLENGMNWDDWSNQTFPTSYKDDCEDTFGATEEYLDWTYYIMSAGNATLTGAGDLDGSFFNLNHAPENYYYGYQVGTGANNVNGNYGNGGWFYGTGLLVDAATQTQVELEDFQGDFAFDADCCPQYTIERTWYAMDCTGNVSDSWTQTISFDDLEGDDVPVQEIGNVETTNGNGLVISNIFPNPIAEKAIINYEVSSTSVVKLDVLDMNGNLVEVLFEGSVEGKVSYQQMFDASGIESGVYLVRLSSDNTSEFERIVVAK